LIRPTQIGCGGRDCPYRSARETGEYSGEFELVDGPTAQFISRHHVKIVPNEYGLCRQVEVSKHRAEDRAAPLRVDTIRMRLELEKVK
jgi:hypothetical protein